MLTCAKLLLIVTNAEARRRLETTWREFVIRQPEVGAGGHPGSGGVEGPVTFSRLRVREGLGLALFIVDGGWRREYVCQALAAEVDGYCLLVGDTPADLSAGLGLRRLLAESRFGLVAGTVAGSEALLHAALQLPPDTRVASVDCDDRQSVMTLVCELLERLAAAPAA
ncbi:MAG: hypothetical protein FJX74_04060 [Armatimonadetes bacterium]|nr:hypothetical protein [Armatimonadota bacterium]